MMQPSPAIGATLIVAGTTIGAGMLALPIIASDIGFFMMAGLMLLTWGLMASAALLLLEVNLAVRPGCSLFVMATETLQSRGRLLAVGSMLFLFYALLSAYIAGGGNQLGQYLDLPEQWPVSRGSVGMLLFAVVFGTLASAGVRRVDFCNRILFLLMLAAFVLALGFMAPEIKPARLITAPTSPWLGLTILPVVFTSFGYHGSIPSLIAYVGPRPGLLRSIFIIGSLIPLLVYLLWLGTALGQLDGQQLTVITGSGAVSDLVHALTRPDRSPAINFALHIFTDLALITSFLGVALGLFDFIHSALGSRSRLKTAAAVYGPPIIIATLLPGAFILALSYAALALAILSILLPALMLNELKKCNKVPHGPFSAKYLLTVLFGLCVFALSLVTS